MPFRTTSRSAFFFFVCGVTILISPPQVLMLSHPRAQIRDTQILAHRYGQSRSARPALRNLVSGMLGAKIQEGEHNSVRRSLMPFCYGPPLYLIVGDGRSCYHGDLQVSSRAMGERFRRGPYSCQTESESKGRAAGSSTSNVRRNRKCSEEGDQATEGCLIWSIDSCAPSNGSQWRKGWYQGQVVV